MASGPLPPPPVNDKPGSFTWLEWYRQLRNYVSTSGSVPWYIINFAGSNITDIAQRDHNNLQGLQGGAAGQMYHVTSAEKTRLANNINTGNINYQVPLTGFSITLGNTDNNLILKPAGTLASGTVTMPVSPIDGQLVTISSTQVVTALTVSANAGQTLNGTITTIAVNGYASWVYRSADTTWYRMG